MLIHIQQVLTAPALAGLRNQLAQGSWVDGRVSVGAQGALVKRNRQLDDQSPLARDLAQQVIAALLAQPRLVSAALPRQILPPFFNSYGGGEHYGDHVDGAIRWLPGTGQPIRADLSATLFLSEPEDYDGGELVIQDTYGEHEVKLAAGDLVLYPSSSLHQVRPVTQGERVCAFLWLQSMVRDDGQRSALFELDQTLQSLRARLGDCAEVLSLTGHYHNLLRRWAEV